MKTNKHQLLSRMDCTFIPMSMKYLKSEEAGKTLIYVYRNSDSKWICVPLHHKKLINYGKSKKVCP